MTHILPFLLSDFFFSNLVMALVFFRRVYKIRVFRTIIMYSLLLKKIFFCNTSPTCFFFFFPYLNIPIIIAYFICGELMTPLFPGLLCVYEILFIFHWIVWLFLLDVIKVFITLFKKITHFVLSRPYLSNLRAFQCNNRCKGTVRKRNSSVFPQLSMWLLLERKFEALLSIIQKNFIILECRYRKL